MDGHVNIGVRLVNVTNQLY